MHAETYSSYGSWRYDLFIDRIEYGILGCPSQSRHLAETGFLHASIATLVFSGLDSLCFAVGGGQQSHFADHDPYAVGC